VTCKVLAGQRRGVLPVRVVTDLQGGPVRDSRGRRGRQQASARDDRATEREGSSSREASASTLR
jgi:hypothetical protein